MTASRQPRLLLGLAALPAMAQDKFPSRPITLVVPFPPGGAMDAIARTLSERLKDALGVAVVAWLRSADVAAGNVPPPGNPIALLPAFGFVAIVAASAVIALWAQDNFGQSGVATSLFLTGSFDVDAAIITLSGLPATTIARDVAALALGGTIVANMALKMVVTLIYARRHGLAATAMLAASTGTLLATLAWRAL